VKVSILGCGWLGTALANSLLHKGIAVKGSTTTSDKLGSVRTHLIRLETAADSLVDPDFFDADLLVVANNVRMNDKEIYLNRVSYTIELIRKYHIPNVIFLSSTSIYGEPNAIVDETTPPMPETISAKLLYQAEQLFQSAPFNCTIIRLGGLYGPGRDPGRFFAGKTGIANGLAPVNLVHLDDAVSLTEKLIVNEAVNLVINAVSSDHPTRMEFYTAAAQRIGLPAPEFIAELKQWKIVNSIHSAYKFGIPGPS
jgi:nucleoside-diphosphate-sugar epimerase